MRIVILMLAALLVVTGIGCGATRGPKGPSGRDRGAWDGKCEAGLFDTCTSRRPPMHSTSLTCGAGGRVLT